MLWINEGFTLDYAGNLIVTSYIDLRDKSERVAIQSLVKGCPRKYALEDGKKILISKPERFREYGPALIRDEQEGFASKKETKVEAETPEEVAERRAALDFNDAFQLVGSRGKSTRRVEYSRKSTQSKSLSYGKDWWIFCAAIRPEENGWEAWRASLDKKYDHFSDIGQPAKFAQALARMVVEKIGPCGEKTWMEGTIDGLIGAKTSHKHQWVIHGPVVYTDCLYDTLSEEEDDIKRMAALLFTKSISHAAQREYRFVVFNGGSDEQTLSLKISGMMRDSLAQTEHGLVRPSPTPAETVGEDGVLLPRPVNVTTKGRDKRMAVIERNVEREETRLEIRDSDGHVLSSDVERRERIDERVGTEEIEIDERDILNLRSAQQNEDTELERSTLTTEQGSGATSNPNDEGETSKELALDKHEWNDEKDLDELVFPIPLHNLEQSYESFENILRDPAFPMPLASTTEEVSAYSLHEIAKSHKAISVLAMKILSVPVEHQQEAASACWHALQCINNIYANFGDIIDRVWIGRHRFVIIRLQKSETLEAEGRIIIGPNGSYTHCFKTLESEKTAHCDGIAGMLALPPGAQVEAFEFYGWLRKSNNEQANESEECDS